MPSAAASLFICASCAIASWMVLNPRIARIDSYVIYINNLLCGAMRGFGAVQVAIAHEAQMDKLVAALGIDSVQLRIANAMRPGTRMPTGQVVPEPAPVAELLEHVRA